MYQELFQKAARWLKAHDRHLPPPASEGDLVGLAERAQAELGASIPPEYEAFLRLADGFDGNGCHIYGSRQRPHPRYPDRFYEGFVEANETWRGDDANRDYLYFGDGDLSRYRYHIASRQYQVADRQGDTVLKVVPSFDALIAEALEQHAFPEE
jgi:hypothetical protein